MFVLMQERRAHLRYPAGECGILRALGPGSSVSEQVAYIVDVSDGGLGVNLDHAIPLGETVRIKMASCSFVDTVVHCRKDGDVFAAGIALCGTAKQVSRFRLTA